MIAVGLTDLGDRYVVTCAARGDPHGETTANSQVRRTRMLQAYDFVDDAVGARCECKSYHSPRSDALADLW